MQADFHIAARERTERLESRCYDDFMGGDHPAAARPTVDAFELAGTGMVVVDATGVVLRANRAYCELTGRRESELIGQAFVHTFPKPAQSIARRTLRAALAPDALPMPSYWTLVRPTGATGSPAR